VRGEAPGALTTPNDFYRANFSGKFFPAFLKIFPESICSISLFSGVPLATDGFPACF
jgi:hypothetical protein